VERYRIARAGKEIGEYDLAAIREYLAKGNLVPTDHAWTQGMSGWQTLAELGITAAPPPPAAPAMPVTPAAAYSAPLATARGGAVAQKPSGNPVVVAIACFFVPLAIYVFLSGKYSKNTKKFLGIWFGVMFAFIAIVGSTAEHKPEPSSSHGMLLNGEKFVLRVLKSPSTAKFPDIISDNAAISCDYFTDGTIYVEGVSTWVDAQNSFGAMIRSRWKVWYMRDASQTSGKLKPVWIQIDGENALGDAGELSRLRELAKTPGGLRAEF